jgi:LysR family glycine cleavage system transcriptional activator
MTRPRRPPLPPLNALRAFEAFGRHGRMTHAADELFVTHGAVSRQIRQLEQWLGYPLTEGPKTALKLTPEAVRLHEALGAAFDLIQTASTRAEPVGDDLRVSCHGTLAIRWLIPRLPSFVARHPEVRVRLVETVGHIDFDRQEADCAVQVRNETTIAGLELTPLAPNHHGPVVAPGVLASGGDRSVLAAPRIHTQSWIQAWDLWARAASVDLPRAAHEQSFDHFSHALEAAAAGLGVAMAPWIFVADDVASGRLYAPLGFITLPGGVVLLRPLRRLTRAGDLFRDWLCEQGAAMNPPPTGPL